MKKYIDIKKIIYDENPKLYHQFKKNPLPIFPFLSFVLREKKINQSFNKFSGRNLEAIYPFLKDELKLTWKIHGKDNIDRKRRYIFVANHSHGSVDGLLFVAAVNHFFSEVKILVNRILLKLEKIKGIFLPIGVFSSPMRHQHGELIAYLKSYHPLLIFPAGVVSRKNWGKRKKENLLVERKWKKSFLDFAITYKRDIVPTFIDIQNSFWFYGLAYLRALLKIKTNLEMFLLPSELYQFKNKHVNIYFSMPISYREIKVQLKHHSKEWLAEDFQQFIMGRFKTKLFEKNKKK